MKVIIAGSRNLSGQGPRVLAVLDQLVLPLEPTEIVSGGAAGTDRFGVIWADSHDIPVRIFRPDWGRFGRGAGFIRNVAMAEYAAGGAVALVWDGKSRGSAHMRRTANERGLRVVERVLRCVVAPGADREE